MMNLLLQLFILSYYVFLILKDNPFPQNLNCENNMTKLKVYNLFIIIKEKLKNNYLKNTGNVLNNCAKYFYIQVFKKN